jgi:hypothetical protein
MWITLSQSNKKRVDMRSQVTIMRGHSILCSAYKVWNITWVKCSLDETFGRHGV